VTWIFVKYLNCFAVNLRILLKNETSAVGGHWMLNHCCSDAVCGRAGEMPLFVVVFQI
jgi:hypothetical protein